jgi:hypothetical protein
MKEYINENFFYIDSLNLDKVNSKLYGFCVTRKDNKISLINNENEEINGCYINVKKNNKDILITTDDFSSLYIFYYIKDNFFALSNSFYILLENLKKNNKEISINKEFILQYIQSPLHSHSLYGTMINEIKILPFGKNIKISNNKIEFIDKNIKLQTISICSKEGINIINTWLNKWINIIKAIQLSKSNIEIDLSGGYDSRITFCLNYATGINLNNENIKIYSKIGQNKGMIDHLMDDYDIAEKITNTLGFNLNNQLKPISKANYYSKFEQYDLLKYTFFGLHKSGYNCVAKYNYPKFHFGGLNGEVIRGSLPNLDEKTIKNRLTRSPIKNDLSIINNFYKDISLLEKNNISKFAALTEFFLTTQCRSHFGLSIFNSYIANIFTLSPFNDKELLKLYVPDEYDKNLIFAIIIYKTCPKIFNIPFTNNSHFSEKTKQKAIELSNKYKFNFIDENLELIDLDKLYKDKENKYDKQYGYDVAYEVFTQNKDLFINKFGELFDNDYATKLYKYADDFYLNKDNFMQNLWINCLTSIIEVFKILYN